MKRFLPEDTAVNLIDHQVGTNRWASTIPLELLQRDVLILARFAMGTEMPVVLTSSQETNVHAQGPLRPELQETLPEAFRRPHQTRGRRQCLGRRRRCQRLPEHRAAELRHGGRHHRRLHGFTSH